MAGAGRSPGSSHPGTHRSGGGGGTTSAARGDRQPRSRWTDHARSSRCDLDRRGRGRRAPPGRDEGARHRRGPGPSRSPKRDARRDPGKRFGRRTADPGGLVWCGNGHLYKDRTRGGDGRTWAPMGSWVQELSEIELFAIDKTQTVEFGHPVPRREVDFMKSRASDLRVAWRNRRVPPRRSAGPVDDARSGCAPALS